jgi:hypothetical protein
MNDWKGSTESPEFLVMAFPTFGHSVQNDRRYLVTI